MNCNTTHYRANSSSVPGDPTNPELYTNLSLAYLRAGRLEDALAGYEETRRLDPDNPSRYRDVSAVLALLGRWEDAAIALLQAIAIDPADHDAALRLVEIYRRFDADGHAVIDLSPDHVNVDLDDPVAHRHRCRAYLGLADIYTRAKEPAAAARMQKRSSELCRPEEKAR